MGFTWLGSRKMMPYFMCKDGSVVVLNVEYNIPYLQCAGKRGVRPRGPCSKQARLPLPPSRVGVYAASSATAAIGITITTHTNTATMTTHVRKHDMATQTEVIPAGAAREAAMRDRASGPSGSKLTCPARAADVQESAVGSSSDAASGVDVASDGAGGGGAAFIKCW